MNTWMLTAAHAAAYNSPRMKVLGVTGTVGSGKSTVCRMLEQMGCPVIDADLEAHMTYRRGTRPWRAIVAAFGEEILESSGDIDRTALGRIVFMNPEARERLNAIVHPATRRRVTRRLGRLRALGHTWAAVEATLLIEAGWRSLVDRLWVVAAPTEAVVERLGHNRGQSEQETLARLTAQMPAQERMEYADDIIYNDGTLEDLRERVRALWRDLSSRESPGG